jgi:hypothetical protein
VAWFGATRRRLEALSRGPLSPLGDAVRRRVDETEAVLRATFEAGGEFTEAAARRLALRLAALSAAVPLAEQGAWALANGRGERSARAAQRFVAARVPDLLDPREAADTLRTSALLAGV